MASQASICRFAQEFTGSHARLDVLIHNAATFDHRLKEPVRLANLKKLRKQMIARGSVDDLDLPGLSEARRPVLPGGLAVLLGCFKALGIETMETSPGALREGVLYDLLGRIRHEDVRDRTIARMVDQYRVDLEQAARVEGTALDLLEQVAADWDLDPDKGRLYLAWAARLHEIGLSVSHAAYHRHSAYLVYHTDMPGFARDDQVLLACLLHNQRRRIRREIFEELLPRRVEPALKLCLLLRLALRLNRSRSEVAPLRLQRDGTILRLTFPAGWEERQPLTRADLEIEARRWKILEWKLEVEPREVPAVAEDDED